MSDLLEIAVRVLEGVTPPEGAFDPRGAWRHVYGVFDLAASEATDRKPLRVQVGTLAIDRTPLPGDGALLKIDWRRRIPTTNAERISGSVKCGPGILAPPTEWEFTWEASSPGQNTSLHKAEKRDYPASFTYTSNWSLFDAVQRLPRKPGEPLRFTMFDEFDLPKPNQTLAFRKTAELALAKGPARLHAFEQFGDGVLPVLYWTDDQGRLLFVISGLIA